MKTLKSLIYIAAFLLITAGVLAQEVGLPDAPSTVSRVGSVHQTLGKRATSLIASTMTEKGAPTFDKRLMLADGLLRGLDMHSTYRLLNDPCGCFRERDPIAPKGKGLGQMMAFQMAAGFAVQGGANYLRHHGHAKWARALVIADIASESFAVVNNYRLQPPAPAIAPTPIPGPTVGAGKQVYR